MAEAASGPSSRSRSRCVLLALLVGACSPAAAQIPADSTAAARRALDEERARLMRPAAAPAAARAQRMIELGLWSEAEALLEAAGTRDAAVETAFGELSFRRHRYDAAAAHAAEALRLDATHRTARLLHGRIQIQAWRLADAAATAEALLAEDPRDADAAVLLGRVRLLEKDYAQALHWSRAAQAVASDHAGGWLLEADTRFWDQDPAGAEAPLVRALELDPFDPDARFAYGYAIWRRVDATQLDAMAAQWALALAIDPLHYVTHWHWGNGHTNLTYADYAHPTDSIVRNTLEEANRLLADGDVAGAIASARAVGREYPESVLPAMLRGSAYYMGGDLPRSERLDSAQAAFAGILRRKPHYGPAHNGLAAVIKQRQFTVLANFDSLEAVIAATPLPTDPRFLEVFDDVHDYPGDRVLRMVRAQLGPTEAYVPMLHRLGLTFTIPPLHVDLADAMGRPSFRYTTTFDNRQWMDIRGVGGGATGIEYVERGAHEERNVLLHEYVHLFHGNVLTDAENRRIRALYHAAMEAERTLDYYAANNESEFFAQAFEAYVMPAKVHPLNHKSMNTTADLQRKDPALFAFVDSMAVRQRTFLAGDSSALRSNWAEVYVALARRAARAAESLDQSVALLDSALVHDDRYLPALLARASLLADHGRFDDAASWLERAAAIDPSSAQVHEVRARLVHARQRAGELNEADALEQRVALLERALDRETDLAERASLNRQLRELLAEHGDVPQALRIADAYAADGPTISTYLRDRRDEALAFADELRAAAGYAREAADRLGALVERKPFQYVHRAQLADALLAAGNPEAALRTIEDGQRVLRAAGEPRADYAVRAAEAWLAMGRADSARAVLQQVVGRLASIPDAPRAVRLLAAAGMADAARQLQRTLPEPETPSARARHAAASAAIAQAAGDHQSAERLLRTAVRENPHDAAVRLELVATLVRNGDPAAAAGIVADATRLDLPLGPEFRDRAAALLR